MKLATYRQRVIAAAGISAMTAFAQPASAQSGFPPYSIPGIVPGTAFTHGVIDQSVIPKNEPSQLELFDNLMKIVSEHHFSEERLKTAERAIASARAAVALNMRTALVAVNDVLTLLDPHSSVGPIRPETASNPEAAEYLPWRDLGLEVTRHDNTARVAQVYYRSNARVAGILEQDVITHVNGAPVADKTDADLYMAICPGRQKTVKLTVRRAGLAKAQDVDVNCMNARPYSVYAQMLPDHVAYIRLDGFTRESAHDLSSVLEEFQTRNPKGYVLDLRDNLGGFVDDAHKIINRFLDSKDIMTGSLTRTGLDNTARATPGDATGGKKLVVLINSGSFSASEMVAGVLQHYKRATVIGLRSGGKGSVQTLYELTSRGYMPLDHDSRALRLRLTTGLYMMPDGSTPQLNGVSPDVEVPDTYTRRHLTPERAQLNVLDNPVSIRLNFLNNAQASVCTPNSEQLASYGALVDPKGKPDLALICAMQQFAPALAISVKTIPVKRDSVLLSSAGTQPR